MLQPIVIYVTGLAGFLALDAVWLSTMAPRVYKPAMGDLVAPGVNLGAAALFYLIYGVGILAFAVMPALGAGRWTTAFALGALSGPCGLRNLRPHEPCHAAQLAHDRDRAGHGLGHACHRAGRDLRLCGGQPLADELTSQ